MRPFPERPTWPSSTLRPFPERLQRRPTRSTHVRRTAAGVTDPVCTRSANGCRGVRPGLHTFDERLQGRPTRSAHVRRTAAWDSRAMRPFGERLHSRGTWSTCVQRTSARDSGSYDEGPPPRTPSKRLSGRHLRPCPRAREVFGLSRHKTGALTRRRQLALRSPNSGAHSSPSQTLLPSGVSGP